MSLRAVGWVAGKNMRKEKLETAEHAFLENIDFSDTVALRRYGVYIDVSQAKHDIMQVKTPDYMQRVNTMLINGNLNFVTGPFYH